MSVPFCYSTQHYLPQDININLMKLTIVYTFKMKATYCFETLVHIYHIPGHPNINEAYYLSTLNTEVPVYFETLVHFYQITRRHIAESSNLGIHCRVNFSAGTGMDIRMMSNCQLLKESCVS
jgi:hypothetical protein